MRAISRPAARIALALAAVLVVGACGRGLATPGKGGVGTATGFNVTVFPHSERRPLPRFSGERLPDGGTISDAAVRGAVAVLNVWGSWCGPCRREQPELERIWREYRARGVRFLGVNVRDAKPNALAYLEEFAVTYPSVYDPSSTIAHKLRVIFAPATYVIDRDGRIAVRVIGALRSGADLTVHLDRLLEER